MPFGREKSPAVNWPFGITGFLFTGKISGLEMAVKRSRLSDHPNITDEKFYSSQFQNLISRKYEIFQHGHTLSRRKLFWVHQVLENFDVWIQNPVYSRRVQNRDIVSNFKLNSFQHLLKNYVRKKWTQVTFWKFPPWNFTFPCSIESLNARIE